MTTKRRRNRNRPQQVDKGPINPYSRPLTEAELQDELDALTWERPTFRLPELDKILEGVEFEARDMIRVYKL